MADLDASVPPHLRKVINATLSGTRNVKRPPPAKPPGNLPIPVPIDPENDSFGGSLYGSTLTGPYDGPQSLSELAGAEDVSLSAPSVYGVARSVGHQWARQQERAWHQEQLSRRPERVAAEAERLLLASMGPTGLDPATWRRLPGRVTLVAERNVRRQEAQDLARLKVEVLDPRIVVNSASAAVKAQLSHVIREAGGASEAGTSVSGGSSRRCLSARAAPRYMETELDKARMRKTLGQLIAKHGGDGESVISGDGSFSTSSSPGRTRAHAHGSQGGGASEGGGAGPGPGSAVGAGSHLGASTVGGSRGRWAAKREARYQEEVRVLAMRVASYLDIQSPVLGFMAARAAQGAGGSSAWSYSATTTAGPGAGAAGGGAGGAGGQSGGGGSPLRRGGSRKSLGGARPEGRGKGSVAFALGGPGGASAGGVGPGAAGAGGGGGGAGHDAAAVEAAREGWRAMQQAVLTGELTEEQVARAQRLVELYLDASAAHGLHTDTGVIAALQGSFYTDLPQPADSEYGSTAGGGGAGALSMHGGAASVSYAHGGAHSVLSGGGGMGGGASSWGGGASAGGAGGGGRAADGAGAAARGVQFARSQHTLHLQALTLTSAESAAALVAVLEQCVHATVLILERCVLSADALCAMLPVLWQLPLHKLRTLNTDFPQGCWPSLQRALGRPTKFKTEACWWMMIRELALSGNALADQGLCALLDEVVQMQRLQTLVLTQCGLTDLSAPQLSRLVAECPTLKRCDLGYNNLGPKAVGAIALALPKTKTLRELSLSWNSIGGGVAQLGWTLVRLGSAHCSLQHLELQGTDLVAQDLFALAAMLRAYPRTPVRFLDLSYNNLVGVAGQCLLRYMNRLMQPARPDELDISTLVGVLAAANAAAAAAQKQLQLQQQEQQRAELRASLMGNKALPGEGGPSATAGGRDLRRDQSMAGRPLAPILKTSASRNARSTTSGGGTQPGGAEGASASPTKRITINASPQGSANGAGAARGSAGGAGAAPAPGSVPLPGMGNAGYSSTAWLAATQGVASAMGPASIAGTELTAAGTRSAASSALLGKHTGQIVCLTEDCEVAPNLPPGDLPQVMANGQPPPRKRNGSDDEDEDAAAHRSKHTSRAHDRHMSADRRRSSGDASVSLGGAGAAPGASTSAASGAAAAAAAAKRVERDSRTGGLSPRGLPLPPPQQEPQPKPLPAGPHAYHACTLDLSNEFPDRTTAALLLEHELEMRRHGYRSAFHAVKWNGRVCKRDGVEVSPLDVMYSGWTHSLPYQGILELVVTAVPPQLAPWLANRRLQFNVARVAAGLAAAAAGGGA